MRQKTLRIVEILLLLAEEKDPLIQSFYLQNAYDLFSRMMSKELCEEPRRKNLTNV